MDARRSITITVRRRHVTVIVAGLALVGIILPVGVEAATGGSVNITDPVTAANKARVTSGRTLATGICDPFSAIGGTTCARVAGGKVRVGDGSGALTVDGLISASTDVVPDQPLTCTTQIADADVFTDLVNANFVGCRGQALGVDETFALTSLTLTNDGTGGTIMFRLQPTSDPDCTIGARLLERPKIFVPQNTSLHLTYPQPLVMPGSAPIGPWSVCGDVPSLPTGTVVWVTVTGFIV